MTHDAAPRIDPRFDPRFQRGYAAAPDFDGMRAAPPSPPPPPAVAAAEAVEQVGSAMAAPVVENPSSPIDRPTSPLAEPAPVTAAETAPPAPDEPLEPALLGATARLWVALAVSVGFIVVGSGVLWSLVSDPDFFIGRSGSSEEQALLQFAVNLTPGVVQAGVMGVLVVLVVWAARAGGGRARRDGAR